MIKVLLLDTNFSSAPIYNFLIKNNYEVFVIGNNTEDYLAKLCLNYYNLDYSDVKFVSEFIKKERIKYIIPGCNDFSYEICSKLNLEDKYFGIESIGTNEIINSKELFRNFAIENGLPVPKTFEYNQLSNQFPIIIKPVDSFSGKGVTIINKKNNLKLTAAINLALENSKKGNYVIEEFVEGKLYSHSAFISKQKIYKDFIVAESCVANPFAVDTSYVVTNFDTTILKKIQVYICKIAKKLQLKDGLIHTQFILNTNKLWIIEITRRCPGDLYSDLIELSTGYPYAEEYTKYFININNTNSRKNKFYKRIVRHTLTSQIEHKLGFLEFSRSLHIKKFISILRYGDNIKIAPRGRVSLLFIESKNIKEFKQILTNLLSRKLYKISNNI